jgi:hypothetical protein
MTLTSVSSPTLSEKRGDTAWLRVAYVALNAAAQLQTDLGDLRTLTRSGFAGHYDHLVVADGLEELSVLVRDR